MPKRKNTDQDQNLHQRKVIDFFSTKRKENEDDGDAGESESDLVLPSSDTSKYQVLINCVVERVANENEIEWNIEFDLNFLFVDTRPQQIDCESGIEQPAPLESIASTSTSTSSSTQLQLRIASKSKSEDRHSEDSDSDNDFTVDIGVGKNGVCLYFVLLFLFHSVISINNFILYTLLIYSVKVRQFFNKNNEAVPGIVQFRDEEKNELSIRCEICRKYPLIVKRFAKKTPIATLDGTRKRTNTLQKHLESQCHIECVQANRLDSVRKDPNVSQKGAAMDIAVNKANERMINYVGKLMIQIFVDAKRLNLSAHSWPARYIAGEASHGYTSQNQSKSIVANDIPLQYVNPPGHQELMTSIVDSHREEFVKKINECVALSLRVDGSVDFTQIDKIYVMRKLFDLNGSAELVFIGIAEQTQRYAEGLMLATIDALKTAVGDPNIILSKISSICTDGTNINTGDKTSLWTLLDEAVKSTGSKIPLQKVWCAAHRAELAWKSTASVVGEMEEVFSILSSISSYFHQSSVRTSELKQIASEHGIKVLALPKLFEIRWSQFTFTLLRSSLVSWEALVIYFGRNLDNAQCAGFYNYLCRIKSLKLIAFLADLTFSFQRFQKKLKSNALTIVSMQRTSMIQSLNNMEHTELPGGFESALGSKLNTGVDGKIYLKSVELLSERPSRRVVRTFAETRLKIIETLRTFLDERFATDEVYFKTIEPFINFDKSAVADIKQLHDLVAPDLSLPNLHLQFEDVSNDPDMFRNLSLHEIITKLSKTAESQEHYKELITTLARIAACTPHSADVERCISAHIQLKTKLRSRISLETEIKYLYIRWNMPVLAKWNPTKAAKLFVTEKSRRNRDMTPAIEKSRQQSHFKGIFTEAQQKVDIDDTEDDINDSQNMFDF